MEIGHVKPKKIITEMQESYLDYAMSVIVSRALPDVRDGLKPVHRRILYAMHRLGLKSGGKFRKCATVVGETIGKYHPHGDLAIYDALVRMAQNFSVRYLLVTPQGNFGSIDGDRQAAMRYTECKMAPLAEEILRDIEKNTVDFADNYDASRQEPKIMPSRVPQLLLNGSTGIAVGMATNIPPHNLGEIVSALILLLSKPGSSIQDLVKFIKGPDFPTGGIIYNAKNIHEIYASGHGKIVMRAKTNIEKTKIIISEIPYQTNKANLVSKIADLVKNKRIQDIKNIRDESDRDGIRVVIELKKDSYPQKVLNQLFKLTDLQKSFHFNMLALIDGIQPRVLSLKEILQEFLSHRNKVVVRRTEFELKIAQDRLHILQGLSKALDHINEVIKLIKQSADKNKAKTGLMKKFNLSDKQADAILEMRLQTLAGLERKKIKQELEEKKKLVIKLKAILSDPKKQKQIIKQELLDLKNKYGDERRTKVFKGQVGEFRQEDLVAKEDTIITITQGGYIKRVNPKIYRVQRRGGKGITGISTRSGDIVTHFFLTNTHSNLLFFTNQGRVFQTKAYEIPEASRTARGQAIFNFLELSSEEKVTAVLPVDENAKGFIVMNTKNGIIKRVKLKDFENVRKSGLIAIKIKSGDALEFVKISSGNESIILTTANGLAIHFNEVDVRVMGRTAAGVCGIKLNKDDHVVSMGVVNNENLNLLVISEHGYGKQTPLKAYKIQKRGGKGLKTAQITNKTGLLIHSFVLNKEASDLIAISENGQVIRTKIKTISQMGRATQGVRVMKLGEEDKVASVTYV